MKNSTLAVSLLLLLQVCAAQADVGIKSKMQNQLSLGQDRGGGDPCEDRIKNIRGDLDTWIKGGGHKDLRLPRELSVSAYEQKMSSAIRSANIQCVGPGDRLYPVNIDGAAKVCRFDRFKISVQVTCDAEKFSKLSESEQYMLIHHEYAGIAGIENPDGRDSNYAISDQITAYLEDQVVKRLAVKSVGSVSPVSPNIKWTEVNGKNGAVTSQRLQDAISRTKFVDCGSEIYDMEPDASPDTCEGQPYYEMTYGIYPHPGNKVVIEKGWEKHDELANIKPILSGASHLRPGRFGCSPNSSSAKKYGQLFVGKSEKGAEVIQSQLRYFLMDSTKSDDREIVHLKSVYQLDKKSQYVESVEFRAGLFYRKNIGLPSNPKWTDDFITIGRFTCRGSK